MKLKALDLFCGAGGVSMGLHRAGFDVVGVDIVPQPRYPFLFIQADALSASNDERPFEEFDYVWASPPCQAYSNAQRLRKNEHPALIERTRALLRRSGKPWSIENVVGAPLVNPVLLCGCMFGLQTYRHRLVESSFYVTPPNHPHHEARTTKMGRAPKDGEFIHVVGNFSGVAKARKAMGIDWMNRNEMSESIPPAYSEFIGRAAIEYIQRTKLMAAE